MLTAPPNGLASDASAVADTLPRGVNHISLYLVGAVSTNGCASPVKICPRMTRPKMPPLVRVPAYRSQLPTNMSTLATMMADLGPLLFRVHRAPLARTAYQHARYVILEGTTNGLETQFANINKMLSQLIAVSETP